MLEHFRQTADLSCVYSVPSDAAVVLSLEQGIRAPEHKRRRVCLGRAHGGFVNDVDDGGDQTSDSRRMFFRTTSFKQLNLQKTAQLGLGMSSELRQHDLAITLHSFSSQGERVEAGCASKSFVYA